MADHQAQTPSVFHLGYVKTGTTTLQREVFARTDLGCAWAGGAEARAALLEWFATDSGYTFDADRVAAAIAAEEAPLRASGLVPVWSAETLLGSPPRRAYHGPEVLRRLGSLPGPKRVLISIREQRAFALSGYRQVIKAGQGVSLTDYIGTGSEPRAYTPVLRPDFLQYDAAVAAWGAVVGPQNVLVMPLEHLARDPAGYFARLADFIGIRAPEPGQVQRRNIGIGAAGLVVARRLNLLQPRSPIRPGLTSYQRGVRQVSAWVGGRWSSRLSARIEARWTAQVEDRYAGLFHDSNRRLEALTGLDLRPWGYQ